MAYRNQYYWIVGISLIVICCVANTTLVVKPRDTSASEGQEVQLECSTSDLTTPISWQYIPVGHGDALPQPKDVFIKGILVNGYEQRFKIHRNSTTGSYDLVIPSVQLSDTGTYRCRNEDGRGDYVNATLTITENTDLQISPEYPEAQVGARVQINCITYHKTEPVNWQHIPLGKSLPDDVYLSGKFFNNYTTGYDVQTDNKTGINSLIITKLKNRDGGLYRCIEQQGHGQHKDAELTVIDTVKCQMFATDACGTSPENVTLGCNMTFSGMFAPLIQWVTAKGDVVNHGVTVTNHSDRVTSTLVIEVDNPSIPLDYTCQAKASTTSCKPNNSAHCQTEVFDSSTQANEPKPAQSSTKKNLGLLALLVLIIIPAVVIIRVIKRREQNRRTGLRVTDRPGEQPSVTTPLASQYE